MYVLQTLARDLDNREKQAAKAITQLKDTSDKLEETDKQRMILTQQLDDTTRKLQVQIIQICCKYSGTSGIRPSNI